MPLAKGQNPNRPKAGSSIKVEPIRTKTAINDLCIQAEEVAELYDLEL